MLLDKLFSSWQAHSTPPPIWDARTRLIDLTGCGDWLTLGQMFTGIGVFGAAGSGKTSSLAILAYALMKLRCGFVWMCAKPDEVQLVSRIATFARRADDLVIVGENTMGAITPHRFNPLTYEASIPTTGTGSLVTYLSDCAKVLSRKEGERAPGEGERFWNDQFERLLRYCIDTTRLAGRTLTVDLLRKIQLTAPKTAAQLAEEGWKEKSVCWQCLKEAEARLDAGAISEQDFNRILDFWLTDYLNLDTEPRSTIDVMFAVLADAFTAEEPIRTILTTSCTVTPEDVIDGGKIVVLSLPTNVYHAAGRMAQFCFKYSFQRAMLRRRKPQDGAPLRPCVLWCDEAHAFAHPFDAQYFAECRSNRGINVFLEQSVGGYMRGLGLGHPEEVDGFLQNLSTKFFFQNNSPQTNLFASDAIGRVLADKETASVSSSLDGAQVGQTTTPEERHQIISGMFGLLKRGGPEYGNLVECFILKPGVFQATGTNVALCRFAQTELTK